MPLDVDPQQSVIVRRIAVTRGQVALRFECMPAFNYALEDHEVLVIPDGVVFRGKSAEALFAQSESCVSATDGYAVSDLLRPADAPARFHQPG
jgi:hypothetical protein